MKLILMAVISWMPTLWAIQVPLCWMFQEMKKMTHLGTTVKSWQLRLCMWNIPVIDIPFSLLTLFDVIAVMTRILQGRWCSRAFKTLLLPQFMQIFPILGGCLHLLCCLFVTEFFFARVYLSIRQYTYVTTVGMGIVTLEDIQTRVRTEAIS